MAVLPIVQWPDRRLAERAGEVAVFDAALRHLAEDMLETMYAAPGRGLAGPQVGAMLRLFVMDCGWKDGTPDPRVIVNPQIVSAEGEATREEGCLSVPGLMVPVTRPDRVKLRWQGLDEAWTVAEFEGFEATCVQHELDHLDGILHIDRTTDEIRTILAPQLKELAARAAHGA